MGHHDAEDVAQITWLRLLTHIDTVREPAKVGAYLQTIARHESIRRSAAGRREDPLADDGHEAPATDADSQLESGLLARERGEVLAAALEQLPARQRALMLMLADDAELSYGEIAEALDIPVGSIGPTRGRSFDRLRRDPNLMAVASAD
jgi:RNA polymerase sigma factor (sigma-70 family)